ncbi:MAG: PAS-domain containing protein [Rhodoferax sp.]|nr:PAS-domain containing protein [Rhodoferax sp.]
MTTRQPIPHVDSFACAVYAWELDELGTLRITGPISRPASGRRDVIVARRALPPTFCDALHRNPDDGHGPDPVEVGRRTVQILHSSATHGFLIQLTNQRRAVGKLAAYVKWLEEGIDSLPEAFVLYDADDRLLIANPRYSQLYPTIANLLRPGITFREISTSAVERGQFRHAEGAEDWLQRRIEFHDKGEGFFEQHLNDGRWIQLSERRTRSGGVTSIRADITLLKEREEALRRAMLIAESTSRSMARFLATFSHEVRNGLNGIAGLAQLLALNAESKSQSSHADLMLQSTRRLTAVLTDLLDYLKNEAIGVAVKVGALSPRDLLHTLRAELELQAAQLQIALRWEVSSDVPEWVEADSGRILQVLANLAGNALKHAGQGTVAIRLSLHEGKLHFEVEDQGIGISPEDQRGLFEYFVQAGIQQPSSTGLGLAICKQLVVAMGGVIGVDSERGRGSRFWFDLPLRIVDASVQAPPVDQSPDAVTPLRIGIVDDDALNRSVAQALVQRLGHHAIIFEDGRHIAEKVKSEALDLLLLDLMMPGESGFDIAARLRNEADRDFGNLILVALTGNVVPDSLVACRHAGIDAILQKPVFIDQLQQVLHWAADKVRGGRTDVLEVFAGSKFGEVVGSTTLDAQKSLAQLLGDIGTPRFTQSVKSAKKLFELAAATSLEEPKVLRRVAHRVAGTAPQLGFGHLGNCARTVDTLLGSRGASAGEQVAIATHVESLHRAARDSLQVLDEQLLRLAPVLASPRARR